MCIMVCSYTYTGLQRHHYIISMNISQQSSCSLNCEKCHWQQSTPSLYLYIRTISVGEGSGHQCRSRLPTVLCSGSKLCNIGILKQLLANSETLYCTVCTDTHALCAGACLLCTVPTGSSNSFWRTNRCGFGTPGFSVLSKVAIVTLCLSRGCRRSGNSG